MAKAIGKHTATRLVRPRGQEGSPRRVAVLAGAVAMIVIAAIVVAWVLALTPPRARRRHRPATGAQQAASGWTGRDAVWIVAVLGHRPPGDPMVLVELASVGCA